jgi:subtilase family serine protease
VPGARLPSEQAAAATCATIRRMRFWATCGCAVAVLAFSAPVGHAAGPSARATRVGAAPPTQQLQLVLPLKADLAGLHRFARSVTTPGAPDYGHYRSIAELARRFGADAATRRHVARYLRGAGATGVKLDTTGLFADATVTAKLAARLFSTPLASYHSARQARFVAPTSAARVPVALRGMVTGVVGLDTRRLGTRAAAPIAASSRARTHVAASQPGSAFPLTGTPSGCPAGVGSGGFVPNQYQTAYGLSSLYASNIRGQGERIALIEIDGFRDADVDAFAKCFGLDVPRLNGFGVGIKHQLAPGGESTLDLEVLDAAAPDLQAIDVYETKPSAADTLKALTAPLQNHGFKPQVISASLGLCEADVNLAVGSKGLKSVEGALQMAASSGITFLSSSGDQGSADCVGLNNQPIDRLGVNYPASSPWVTGVGGTNIELDSANRITRQVVWNDTSLQPGAAGGGGSSMLFGRPSYQKGIVKQSARAVPDVSMLADIVPGYAVYCSATGDCVTKATPNPWQTVGGTSAATPLLAGGLALVDQQLRLSGRSDLGFVNPLLYRLGHTARLNKGVLADVLQFGNDVGLYIRGTHKPLGCCTAGAGYDRASGWGSLNVLRFAAAAVALTPPNVSLSLPRPQHVVKRKAIVAAVACTAACRAGAVAEIRIGLSKPLRSSSHTAVLPAAGKVTATIPLSAKQLSAINAGLSHHRSAHITVTGVIYGSGTHVLRHTPGKTLTIS